MHESPADYDLILISFKMVEHKQSRSSYVPLLAELTPRAKLIINPATAKAKGIDDGQEVWIESHNAVTGETRRVKIWVAYTEGIRPDTVAMPHHFGLGSHPTSKDLGPSPNEIFYTGDGYTAAEGSQAFQVKVKVEPA